MLSLLLGLTAFVLYFLYDLNSITVKCRIANAFFMIGTVLLALATILELFYSWNSVFFVGTVDMILLIGAGICFCGLIYCLFFALPFKDTYVEQSDDRCVYSGGVYGLCRHPGVLFFWGMYLMLGIAALPGKMIVLGMLFSILNVIYAYFQDRYIFPKTFCDYLEYRKTVPFLVPTMDSLKRVGKCMFRAKHEEDML